jgi:hypothetical protein
MNVADVDAQAKSNPLIAWKVSIALDHAALDIHGHRKVIGEGTWSAQRG